MIFLSDNYEDHQFGGNVRLAIPVEFMRICDHCSQERRFIAEQACSMGLLGWCATCGTEFLVQWTRTNSEAA